MTSSRDPLRRPFTALPKADTATAPDDATATESAPVTARVSCLFTVEDAAKLLSTTPTALRARCRRRARRVGREIVARLGAGVVAFKFGVSWRLRIDPP